jgi:hypothetical protein
MPATDYPPLKVELFSFYGDAPRPEKASPHLRGSMPVRAVQVCPPITAASGFGWYLFPPVDFAVRWDGQASEWALLEDNEPVAWRSLAGGVEHSVPISAEALATAPERFAADTDIFDAFGGALPFIDADPRAGHLLEIITGVIARTSPGWCLLARGVANWPHSGDFQVLEGVLDTEWFRSWVPTMVRLTTPHRIVRFYRSQPITMLQPIPRAVLEAAGRATAEVAWGLDEFPDDIWGEFVDQRRRRQVEGISGRYRRDQMLRAKARANGD